MARMSPLNSPLLLGFDEVERMLDQIAKSTNDGYPPYNIEQVGENELGITVAVAGFSREELSVTEDGNKLVIRGRQEDDPTRVFLHRGIAARQFQKSFVLADGIEVVGAELDNGLLSIRLQRPQPNTQVREIAIGASRPAARVALDDAAE